MSIIQDDIISYIEEEKQILDKLKEDKNIITLINYLLGARNNEKRIWIMGNGGSGASASHWVNDFNKGMLTNRPFDMICLNDNVATLTAIANDDSYENVFQKQLEYKIKKDDLVIGISGSGNSKNVVKAFDYANCMGAITFAIVGFNGGQLKKVAKQSIHIETHNMGIFEDISMVIDHIIFDLFK